ncbi:MAG TPA: hypothetical protein VMV94_11600 [Phycisphaerae bacterium]|nr:hypothetical protein [Phycisphaerae bacterium]
MRRLPIYGVMGLAILVAAARAVADEPKPSPTPISWELTFKPAPLERIQVDTGKGPETYWYMIYTVINDTGQDVDFFPEVVRVSEIDSPMPATSAPANPGEGLGMIVEPALIGGHPKIYEAIKQLYGKTRPFLVSPVDAIGRLLQGKDNARTSVFIFPDLDPRVTRFTIYFGGLSGEKVSISNPKYDPRRAAAKEKKADAKPAEDKDNPQYFVLRKTLAMPYTLPGDAKTRRSAAPAAGPLNWVMR